jgi:uncharacterized protein YbjT (DUF2867 family)
MANTITISDGITIYYKDWGSESGRPIVFSHGWPLDADAFDWEQLSSYLPAVQGVDRLFLLAPNSERQVGYLLQAVRQPRAGGRRLVRVSVMGADAEPGIILGRQHVAAEREIRASEIGWTMLRPTFFMDNFIRYYGIDPHKDSQVWWAARLRTAPGTA